MCALGTCIRLLGKTHGDADDIQTGGFMVHKVLSGRKLHSYEMLLYMCGCNKKAELFW